MLRSEKNEMKKNDEKISPDDAGGEKNLIGCHAEEEKGNI